MTTKALSVQSAMYQCALKMQAMWQLLLERCEIEINWM